MALCKIDDRAFITGIERILLQIEIGFRIHYLKQEMKPVAIFVNTE